MNMYRYRCLLLILCCLSIIKVGSVLAQQSGETPETMAYPKAMEPWSTEMAFGASLMRMPEEIAQEGAYIRWPLFHYDIVMGLPENLLLQGTLSTEIVTNHIELSGRWVYNLTDKLHADVGAGFGYLFAQLKVDPYDNTMNGTFLYPSAAIGYDFGKLALSLRGKLHYVTSLSGTTGRLEETNEKNFFNGFSYRITLEQLFWGHSTFGLAFQLNYLKFYYPQWPLFPTFNKYFWIPETQFWFTL
jgi:hypothetical protein